MIHAQNEYKYHAIPPQAVGTDAVTGVIDTRGYDYATVDVQLAAAATSVSVSALAISEGDTTSAYTAITSLTGGTDSGNFTLPTADGTDSTGQVLRFEIDCRKRKRYLKVSLTNSASRVSAATATGHRIKDVPVGATQRGLETLVQV